MSIPYSSNPGSDSLKHDQIRDSQATLPVKPFRVAASSLKYPSVDPKVLNALYNDNKEIKRAFLNGFIAVCIIAGSIIAKTGFTYATLALIVIGIFGLALIDTWNAVLLFTVYLALEGMYKYTSAFNPVVYIMAPLLAMTIFVAWGIRTKSKGEETGNTNKESIGEKPTSRKTAKAKEVALPTVSTLVFALMALSLLQSANPESPGIFVSLNGAIVWYIGPMSFFFIAYQTLKNRKDALAFVYTMLIIGVVVSGYAIVQFNMGKDWVYSHVPGFQNMLVVDAAMFVGKTVESTAYRPASTYSFAGGYVVAASIALLAALCVATMPRMLTWRRVLALGSVAITVMGIALSGVRMYALGLSAVIPLMLAWSARRFEDVVRIFFMTFIVTAVVISAFLTADIAASGKVSKRFLGVFTTNPVKSYSQNRAGSLGLLGDAIVKRPFGIGIRRSTGGQDSAGAQLVGVTSNALYNRETQFNSIHLDLGVFAVISLVAFFVTVLFQGARICRTLPDPNLRSVAILMYVVVVLNIIACFGGPSLNSNYAFWTSCGILYALPRINKEERKKLTESMEQGKTLPVQVLA